MSPVSYFKRPQSLARRGVEEYRGVEKSRSRSRSRERRSKDRSTGSRDDGTGMSSESDFAKLTLALTDAIRMGSKQAKYLGNETVLLEFDPELRSISVLEWLN